MKVHNTKKVYNMLFDGIFSPIPEKESATQFNYTRCPETQLKD